jgi:hypothetical protein
MGGRACPRCWRTSPCKRARCGGQLAARVGASAAAARHTCWRPACAAGGLRALPKGSCRLAYLPGRGLQVLQLIGCNDLITLPDKWGWRSPTCVVVI